MKGLTRMRRIIFTILPVLTLMVVPAMVAAEAPTTAPSVYVTPADVYAAAAKASRSGDSETLIDCQSPDNQEKLVKLMMFFVIHAPTTAPSISDSDKEKAAFFAKYGLDHHERRAGETDTQLTDRLAAQIPDKAAFLKEMGSIQRAHNKQASNSAPVPALTNVQIEGDGNTAVGKLISHDANGVTMSMDVQFKKINGSWKIDSLAFF
jgi:hypothetical protein